MRTTRTLALAAIALFALTACDDDPVSPSPQGRLRAVHAISNVANIDVLFGTANYKTNMAYKAHDGYKTTATGTTAVKFRKNGVATDLLAVNATVANAADYTVIALGTEAAPQSMVLTDNNSAPAAGKVKFRVAHAAAALDAFDVYILLDATTIGTATPDKANLTAKTASAYITKDPGTYTVIFTAAGTKTPALSVPNVQVAAGNIRTVVAVEKAGGGQPLEGITLNDNPLTM